MRSRNASGKLKVTPIVTSQSSPPEPTPDPRIDDEIGRSRAPAHAEERGMLRPFPAGLLSVDLADYPDGWPHRPRANHARDGDGLPASPLDTTA